MGQACIVELRPRRWQLLLTAVVGLAVLAYAIWTGGAFAWLGVALGGLFTVGSGYWLIRDKPRITLSDAGIEWGFEWRRRNLAWTEIESMREVRWGGPLTRRRLRLLAIRTVGNVKGARASRMLYGAHFTINISALERSAQEVLALIEQFSGREVERVPLEP